MSDAERASKVYSQNHTFELNRLHEERADKLSIAPIAHAGKSHPKALNLNAFKRFEDPHFWQEVETDLVSLIVQLDLNFRKIYERRTAKWVKSPDEEDNEDLVTSEYRKEQEQEQPETIVDPELEASFSPFSDGFGADSFQTYLAWLSQRIRKAF